MSVLDRLVGTWRLLSIAFEMTDTGETVTPWGDDPSGWLILTRSGRLMTVCTPSGRALPATDADAAALLKTMVCYSGQTRIESESRWVTTVDAAWHPSYDGSQQPRNFQLDGDRLFVRTDPKLHPSWPGRLVTTVLAWQRAD